MKAQFFLPRPGPYGNGGSLSTLLSPALGRAESRGLFPWVGQRMGSQPQTATSSLAGQTSSHPHWACAVLMQLLQHLLMLWGVCSSEMNKETWTQPLGAIYVPTLWAHLTAFVCALHQTQETRATREGSKNTAGFCRERLTFQPNIKPRGLQAYPTPHDSHEHTELFSFCQPPF